MQSPAFHRFVRSVYNKVNGIDPHAGNEPKLRETSGSFKPTAFHKFKAWRLLFYDEMRSSFGMTKKHNI
ncbi:CYFA0S13e03202g1_1 [Cyberlindnera fabianii]|uniref:CYFA0S13e03202g1_1 n=1 Tax=Cyberlindnera fabianii TaxID=36022 RepID=A0A061B873_CYBFA|nr:CYFA0S13e03202g1_1 [Cyberlindnera fabianii]